MKSIFITLLGIIGISLNIALAGFDQEHTKFSKILKAHTKTADFQTLVNYKAIKESKDDLLSYLSDLESLRAEEFKVFSRHEKLAFWINAYNAYTILLVINNYPVKSIKNIGGSFFGGLFGGGPWKIKFIKLFNKNFSLDEIEHEEIRKKFKEPRIHFALNCASIGCPSLLRESFTAENLEGQFESVSQNFLNNKTKNHFDKNTLYLSKIFKWYGADFDPRYGGFKNYVIKHYQLKGDFSVSYNSYDWSLNDY